MFDNFWVQYCFNSKAISVIFLHTFFLSSMYYRRFQNWMVHCIFCRYINIGWTNVREEYWCFIVCINIVWFWCGSNGTFSSDRFSNWILHLYDLVLPMCTNTLNEYIVHHFISCCSTEMNFTYTFLFTRSHFQTMFVECACC